MTKPWNIFDPVFDNLSMLPLDEKYKKYFNNSLGLVYHIAGTLTGTIGSLDVKSLRELVPDIETTYSIPDILWNIPLVVAVISPYKITKTIKKKGKKPSTETEIVNPYNFKDIFTVDDVKILNGEKYSQKLMGVSDGKTGSFELPLIGKLTIILAYGISNQLDIGIVSFFMTFVEKNRNEYVRLWSGSWYSTDYRYPEDGIDKKLVLCDLTAACFFMMLCKVKFGENDTNLRNRVLCYFLKYIRMTALHYATADPADRDILATYSIGIRFGILKDNATLQKLWPDNAAKPTDVTPIVNRCNAFLACKEIKKQQLEDGRKFQ